MYPINDPNERAQVEEVFGLTGGELSDRPLRYCAERVTGPLTSMASRYPSRSPSSVDNEREISGARYWARYWYEGTPDYCAREYARREGHLLTIVACELFGLLPDAIYAHGRRYSRMERFTTSGETECPERSGDTCIVENPERAPCSLCGESWNEPHGFIYIGDGWSETVYFSPESED